MFTLVISLPPKDTNVRKGKRMRQVYMRPLVGKSDSASVSRLSLNQAAGAPGPQPPAAGDGRAWGWAVSVNPAGRH